MDGVSKADFKEGWILYYNLTIDAMKQLIENIEIGYSRLNEVYICLDPSVLGKT